MRALTAAVAAALLAAGCGGGTAPAPPSAKALAAKMGCVFLAPGFHVAGYDLVQDIRVQGSGPGCNGGEIFTFPSQKAETDWLHQASASSSQAYSLLYPWIVVGHLWAVQPGDSTAIPAVIKAIGGRAVTLS